jgi:hypothetical protein
MCAREREQSWRSHERRKRPRRRLRRLVETMRKRSESVREGD